MLIAINKQLGKWRTPILVISAVLIALGFAIDRRILIAATFVAVLPIFIKALMALTQKAFSIEMLVVIAVIGALYLAEYNESSLVSFFFLFGDFLEAKTLEKTRNSIKGLLDLVPQEATVLRDGEPVLVPVDEIEIGDHILMKTGEKVAVDGVIIEGTGNLNQASMTGESLPVYKEVQDEVFAGTILELGTLVVEAKKVGDDTSFAQMIELVEEAQETKTTAEKFLNRFAKWYTPLIVVLSVVVYFITKNLHMAITFLVIACPGALVIGAPVSTVVGIGNAARQGVLFKGGESLEKTSQVDTVLFDKTGTLTKGVPAVTLFDVFHPENEQTVIDSVFYAEQVSEHPLGQAISGFLRPRVSTDEKNITASVVPGQGVKGERDGKQILVGNEHLIETHEIEVPEALRERIRQEQATGKTVMLMAIGDRIEGLIGIEDPLKEGAIDAIASLRKSGIKNIFMLSGDHQETVTAVAAALHLDGAYGSLHPQDKADLVKKFKGEGRTVLMAGDGVNDAAAIALADVGLAMGMGGSDVSIETSDVVLMSHELKQIAIAKRIAKQTVSNIRQNTGIAMVTVLLLLAGVLMQKVGLSIGMFVHEGSILLVLLNAMRMIQRK